MQPLALSTRRWPWTQTTLRSKLSATLLRKAQAKKLQAVGEEALRAGDYSKAVDNIAALKLDPSNAEAAEEEQLAEKKDLAAGSRLSRPDDGLREVPNAAEAYGRRLLLM